MSTPTRMMTTVTSVLLVLLTLFFIFFNTSMDDQRSSTLRQIVTTSLNKKAVRKMPTTNDKNNQKVLAHYSIQQPGKLATGWKVNATTFDFEQAVWENLYATYGSKISHTVVKKGTAKTTFGSYSSTTRSRTWSYNGQTKGTIIFNYLYKGSLDDVYAVKVQTIIDNHAYTVNLGIIHDTNWNNFGSFSGVPVLSTASGLVDSNDHKSGESINKTYTTDNGYNLVWDTEFIQPLTYGMDHIKLTYQFDQAADEVTIPKTLKEIYPSEAANPPTLILQSTTGKQPFTISANQVKIINGANSRLELTLTPEQSARFLNIDYSTQERMLFRVYTHVNNGGINSDYATAQAKLETMDKNNKVLKTQTSDMSKVRITPFGIQPIDTRMTLKNAQIALTHFTNLLYPTGQAQKATNATIAQSQYDFAKDANTIAVK